MRRHPYDLFVDQRFHDVYQRHPVVLVDVGARGGLKHNWAAARPHLRVLGFEPDRREYDRLAAARPPTDAPAQWFDVALHNRTGPLRLHVARDRGLTSIFEPDRTFLSAFPESDRFDTVDVRQVQAETLDNLLRAHGVADVDFLKADTQGSELFVLEGGARALARSAVGVEVEVEFTPIYREQPVFADVDRFLRALGFLLFDVRPCYWKRSAGRNLGGPRGQIIWADALYLRSPQSLRTLLGQLDADADLRVAKVLKALSITVLYGYFDYALEILRDSADVLGAGQPTVIERWLRDAGGRHVTTRFPGQRRLAAGLHWLWKMIRPQDDAWSVSGANLGNLP